jgi:hypothetical protein
VLDHPLVQHTLTILREKRPGIRDLKELVSETANRDHERLRPFEDYFTIPGATTADPMRTRQMTVYVISLRIDVKHHLQ